MTELRSIQARESHFHLRVLAVGVAVLLAFLLIVWRLAVLQVLRHEELAYQAESNRTAVYSTDDYGFTKQIYDAQPRIFSMAGVEFALWDVDYVQDDTRENFWHSEYTKIFNANMVLESLDRVAGSQADKDRLKADAHLVRAYSYLSLANVYCLPYTEATRDEPGLPIKTGTSFEDPTERRPLHEVYAQIEADLAEAMKTTVPLVQQGRPRHWRANTAAVNGFAARYYLIRNDYDLAWKHANNALTEYSQLVDYNTEMHYGQSTTVTIDAGTAEETVVTLQFPYTHDNQVDFTDMIQWKEFLYFRMLNHESWWYIPSQALLDLYDQANDLRYAYHFVKGYSYDRTMTKPSYNWPGYVFFFKDRIPSGPTVAEMILIKAECEARQNRVTDAMNTVNTLRAKRLKPGPWVNLSAANQDEAIKKVLEERRRELPYTQRWSDIRRFNNNDYPADDVELSRSFYPYTASNVSNDQAVKTYTLPKHSRRFAAPIPRTEIISSQGAIVQNGY